MGILNGLYPILKGYNYNDIYSFDFPKVIPNEISTVQINNNTIICNDNDYDGPDNVSNISAPSYNVPSFHASGGAVGDW